MAAIDARFLLDERKWEALCRVVEAWWPEAIGPDDLGLPEMWDAASAARGALMKMLGLI